MTPKCGTSRSMRRVRVLCTLAPISLEITNVPMTSSIIWNLPIYIYYVMRLQEEGEGGKDTKVLCIILIPSLLNYCTHGMESK